MSDKPLVRSDLDKRRAALRDFITKCDDVELLQTLSVIAGCETEVSYVTRWEADGLYAEAFIDRDGRTRFALAFRDEQGEWNVRPAASIETKQLIVLPTNSDLVTLPGPMASEPQELDALFRDTLDFILRYVTLTDEFAAGLAAWVLGTWFHQKFEAFPLLHLYGVTTAGKSRVQKIVIALAYHPMPRLSGAREALIVRCIQTDHPTMVLDEMDAAPESKMGDVIRSGFERDGFVIRNDGEGYKGRKFPSYCPKSFSGQAPMTDSALITRQISENMSENERGDGVVDDLSGEARVAFDKEAASLRARCLRFAMDTAPTLKPVRPDVPGLDDRGRQVFRPLWTLTSSDGLPLLGRLARRYIQGLSRSMLSTNDGWLGAAVVRFLEGNGVTATFQIRDIQDLATSIAGYSLEMQGKEMAAALRRIGCRQEKKLHPVTRQVMFSVHPNTYRKLQRLYGTSDIGEEDI